MLQLSLAYLRRQHLAVLALFVALGGTSYAAATIGSADIKNNTIQSQDVKQNTLTGADVKDGSLDAKDLNAGTALAGPAGCGPTGSQGPKGEPGAAGAPGAEGAQGSAGATNAYVKYLLNLNFAPGTPLALEGSMALPAGRYAVTASVKVQNNDTTNGTQGLCRISGARRSTPAERSRRSSRARSTARRRSRWWARQWFRPAAAGCSCSAARPPVTVSPSAPRGSWPSRWRRSPTSRSLRARAQARRVTRMLVPPAVTVTVRRCLRLSSLRPAGVSLKHGVAPTSARQTNHQPWAVRHRQSTRRRAGWDRASALRGT